MNRSAHIRGLGATFVFHVVLVGFVVANADFSCGSWEPPTNKEQPVVIEASLAFKGKKYKNPQKRKKKKFKPNDADKVARDDTPPPPEPEKPDEKKLDPEPDEIDYEAVTRKNRLQDDDLGDTGNDVPEGDESANASEWGTASEASGDPYVATLENNVRSVWVPVQLGGTSESVLACVKLNRKGEIVEKRVREKSSNATLNRSAEIALNKAPDMGEPVPEILENLLVRRGICFNLQPE